MKNSTIIIALCLASNITRSQVFNFYGTEYYLAPDAGFDPGTVLTPSGNDLSSFNYSSADPSHPLFTAGIYYPVQDCANRNLWVRVQHIAHDPNGTENGFNIVQTLNSPFLPLGSTDRIGGWAGFLYDIRIFADAQLSGERLNELAMAFPTNITVESLETLYNDGGSLYEWLSFEILNEETGGWSLNSINFTGINPYSNPGFSSELNYSTTATMTEPPTGFSTDFPTGSPVVYAIDLNLSGAEHSEFRMGASNVSHFNYGYEFTTGGYQGMSMAFGNGPVINSTSTPVLCADEWTGSIVLDIIGYEPFVIEWSNGSMDNELVNVPPGDYTVTVTDAAGCSTSSSAVVDNQLPLIAEINLQNLEGGLYLVPVVSGGVGDYSYEWNTGETTPTIEPISTGNYTVTITDSNGCTVVADFLFVGISLQEDVGFSIFPNPAQDYIIIKSPSDNAVLQISTSQGKVVHEFSLTGNPLLNLDISDLPPSVYTYQYLVKGKSGKHGILIVE